LFLLTADPSNADFCKIKYGAVFLKLLTISK